MRQHRQRRRPRLTSLMQRNIERCRGRQTEPLMHHAARQPGQIRPFRRHMKRRIHRFPPRRHTERLPAERRHGIAIRLRFNRLNLLDEISRRHHHDLLSPAIHIVRYSIGFVKRWRFWRISRDAGQRGGRSGLCGVTCALANAIDVASAMHQKCIKNASKTRRTRPCFSVARFNANKT